MKSDLLAWPQSKSEKQRPVDLVILT